MQTLGKCLCRVVVLQTVLGFENDGQASETAEVLLDFLVVVVFLVVERKRVLQLDVPAQLAYRECAQYGKNFGERENREW